MKAMLAGLLALALLAGCGDDDDAAPAAEEFASDACSTVGPSPQQLVDFYGILARARTLGVSTDEVLGAMEFECPGWDEGLEWDEARARAGAPGEG